METVDEIIDEDNGEEEELDIQFFDEKEEEEIIIDVGGPEKSDDDEEELPPKKTIEIKKKENARQKTSQYQQKDLRLKFKALFTQVLKSEKNGEILEKHLNNTTIGIAKDKNIPAKFSSLEYTRLYVDIGYNLCHKLNDQHPLKQLIEELKERKIMWNDPTLVYLKERRLAEDNSQINEVKEGIHECHFCGSKKTTSYDLQTRSADEGMTTFIKCANPKCKKMWKQYN